MTVVTVTEEINQQRHRMKHQRNIKYIEIQDTTPWHYWKIKSLNPETTTQQNAPNTHITKQQRNFAINLNTVLQHIWTENAIK